MTISHKTLITTCCTLITIFIIYIFLPPQSPLSPLSPFPIQPPTISHKPYAIFGFLPYWNLKKLSPEAINSITHLTYFTLHLGDSGQLIKYDNPGEEEPGYTNYKRILNRDDLQPNSLILTFMPYDQNALISLLNNSYSRKSAIKTITNLVQESKAVGINIDYEPLGDIPPSLKNNFTLFIQELSSKLHQLPSTTNQVLLTISTYASVATKARIWDLTALSPLTDYFVIMTYDYHLPTDSKSGPNSPLRGAGNQFKHDILTNLAEITKLIDSRQILLGIPFYGYEWDTDTNMKYAPTDTRASVASLERIQELIDKNTLELLWDHNSLTPYAIRREKGKIISQIYYESIDSIKLKLELVKSANLGGIAIWALGYEGNYPNLWSTINSLNN